MRDVRPLARHPRLRVLGRIVSRVRTSCAHCAARAPKRISWGEAMDWVQEHAKRSPGHEPEGELRRWFSTVETFRSFTRPSFSFTATEPGVYVADVVGGQVQGPSGPVPVEWDGPGPGDVVEGVEVYPFHRSYPGLPDLFHVRCEEHGPIFGCEPWGEAQELRAKHIRETHRAVSS